MDTQALSDRAEITDVLYRYSRGVDRLDYELIRSCYHDDALDEHGYHSGDPDAFIAWLQSFKPEESFVGTQHFLGNILIDLDGDTAHSETYCVAYRRLLPDDRGVLSLTQACLRYVDRFERRDGRWAIAHRVVVYDFGGTSPVAEDLPLAPDAVTGRRLDRSDAVYQR